MGDRREKSLNPILTRIANAKKQEVHRHKLKTITSTVDSSCPRSLLKGRRKNPKKAQMDEDRYAHIERENRKLLIQMSNIMLRRKEKNAMSHVSSLNLPQRQRDIKRINHHNKLLLDRIEKTQPYCKNFCPFSYFCFYSLFSILHSPFSILYSLFSISLVVSFSFPVYRSFFGSLLYLPFPPPAIHTKY